ncbi:cellulose binding domain-containing protein [Chitinophaga eiseniae]|uniref:CBM3 domain-containing protein n=1 Tax=Chitinophaga eiseniae TaxID=634771 RepID=A0A847SBP9_9BACT|nr:cellulose binding domain-containing protein [Chitinophaga eiseniae]NLR77163.1 hypothetical protein [Chitinophaga eiseniae]
MKPLLKFYTICFLFLLLLASHLTRGQTFVHPGILHTDADFQRIKLKLQTGAQPWKSGWDKLIANSHAQLGYTPNPSEAINRGGSVPQTYVSAMNDAAAAYQCALRWKITGDPNYAAKAVQILNAWAAVCKGVGGDTNGALAVGFQGFAFANAAELVRDYSGWAPADFERFKKFMMDVFYSYASGFLYRRNGTCPSHYWANWGMSNVSTMMAIGILCDDVYIFNEAMFYLKSGNYTEAIKNVVYYLHTPTLGQWQESNRDQGHSLLGVGLAADVCEMAWNQGEDLYSYDNSRLLAGFEYVAKYNLGDTVPNIPYNNCENANQQNIGETGRGGIRPIWERLVNHYQNRMGISIPYSKRYLALTRPEGGGGDYGSTSGGFDHLGFGTLTSALDSMTTNCPPSMIRAKIQYNGQTLETSTIQVKMGSNLTLHPESDAGGSWSWSTGASGQDLVLNNIQHKGVYRVTLTNACGAKKVQLFALAIEGDCQPAFIIPYIQINGVWQNTNQAVVERGATIKLGPQGKGGGISGAGRYQWSTGDSTSEVLVANIQKDTLLTLIYTGPCGQSDTAVFTIQLRKVHDELKQKLKEAETLRDSTLTSVQPIAGRYPPAAKALLNDSILYVRSVYDSTTSTDSQVISYINLLDRSILRYKQAQYYGLNDLADGLYYIKIPLRDSVLTVNQTNAPRFDIPLDSAYLQVFSITKEPNGRYKIMTTGTPPPGYQNYLNENAQFGRNNYDATWNTVNLYFNGTTYAMQRAEKAGNGFWYLSGQTIASQTGANNSNIPVTFPFELKPDLYSVLDARIREANAVLNSTVSSSVAEPGKYPVAAKNRLQDSVNSVVSAYSSITVSSQSYAYVKMLQTEIDRYRRAMYVLLNTLNDGIYTIQPLAGTSRWTAGTTNSPDFVEGGALTGNQRWRITKETNGRYKIICFSAPQNYQNYINENAQFGTNVYDSTWHTFNIYADGNGYAIQRAARSGNGYWYINTQKINAVGGNTNDPMPFSFPFRLEPAPDTQQITFENIQPVLLGDTSGYMLASSSAGLSVQLSLVDSTAARIIAGKLYPLKAGAVQVKASQAGNGYYAAVAVTQSVEVKSLGLTLKYRDGDNGQTFNNMAKPFLQLSSSDTSGIALDELEIRYWLTPENYTGINTWIDYASIGATKITTQYVPLATPYQRAWGYVQYRFLPEAGYVGTGNAIDIQSRWANMQWGLLDETNDHSYLTASSYTGNPNITLYRKGLLVAGNEPLTTEPVVAVTALTESLNSSSNTISTKLNLQHSGNTPVKYNDLKIRYWFTKDGGGTLNSWIDFAVLGSGKISAAFTETAGLQNADHYLELGFVDSTALFYPQSSSGNIQFRITKSDWSAFDKNNDFSMPQQPGLLANPNVTVYLKGALIYGTEPSEGQHSLTMAKSPAVFAAAKTGNLKLYPNPASNYIYIDTKMLSLPHNKSSFLTLVDVHGKQVLAQVLPAGALQVKVNLPSGLPAGTYWVRIGNNVAPVVITGN